MPFDHDELNEMHALLEEKKFGLPDLLRFIEFGLQGRGQYPLLAPLVSFMAASSEANPDQSIPCLLTDAYRQAFYVKETAESAGFGPVFRDPESRTHLMRGMIAVYRDEGIHHTEHTLSADESHAH